MTLTFEMVAKVAGSRGGVLREKIKKFVINSKEAGENDCFFAFKGAKVDGNDFVDEVLKRKGFAVMTDKEKVKQFIHTGRVVYAEDPIACLKALAQINRRGLKARFVTVTGACGKTTTKEFIGTILSTRHYTFITPENQNNLLGVSLALCNISDDHEYAVIETGTNKPGEVRELTELVQPHGSITTNVLPSHLQFFKNVQGVLEAETEQKYHLESIGGFWCLNHDDKYLREFSENLQNTRLIFFGQKQPSERTDGVFVRKIQLLEEDGLPVYRVFLRNISTPITLKAFGSYNAVNLAGAVAAVKGLGVQDLDSLLSSASLTTPAHRSQFYRSGTNLFIIDCYNANPGSFKAAIKEASMIRNSLYVKKRLVGVFADMLELGSKAGFYHYMLSKWIKNAGFTMVLFLGEFAQRLSMYVPSIVKPCESLDHLRQQVKNLENCVVLIKGSHMYRLEQVLY